MAVKPQNLLVIMSDEHNPKIAGYAGHPIIKTLALDALAARGTRFTAAYTPSPICVPARASLATGLPVHRHRAWDNAIAYDGHIAGWAHALRERGHHVATIGKLHYRGHPDDDYGFTESQLAMHITGGVGDVTHLVRDPDDIRTTGKNLIDSAGPGESSYTLYDRQVAAAAQIWLRETGTRWHARPWVLFVSMVAPHFPLTAPPEHYYRYIGRDLPRPKLYDKAERPEHAYVRMYARRYLRHEAGLGGRVRELAILTTARELDSLFEWAGHVPDALGEGISREIIEVIKHRKDTNGLDEADAIVIELGREIFGARKVASATFARSLLHFGLRALVDLVALMGNYAGTAALLTAFDMQLDPGQPPPLPQP